MQNKIKRRHIYIPGLFTTLILIVLAGGCLNTFDYKTYKYLYIGIYKSKSLEPIYGFLQNSFNSIGINYNDFRLFIIAISLSITSVIVYRTIGNKILLFDFFYLFYSLAFDSVNIRNTLANAIVLVGFIWCIKSEKHGVIKYIICCAVATLCHTLSLAYLIFVYAFFKNKRGEIITKRKRYGITVFVIIFISIVLISSKTVLQSSANIIWNVLTNVIGLSNSKAAYFTISGRYGFLLFSFCHIAFTFTIAYVRSIFRKSVIINESNDSVLFTSKLIECVYLCNILLILYLPLLRINTELYRIFRGITAIEYIAFFACCKYIPRGSKPLVIAYALMLFTIIINFCIQILPYAGIIFNTMFTGNRFF